MYLLESPRRGDSNKDTKCIIYKKKCSKVSITDALDGSCLVSLQQQIRFYSKIFGNKHCVITRALCILHGNSCKQTVDPDQTLHSVASELGLHCLHIPQKGQPVKRI